MVRLRALVSAADASSLWEAPDDARVFGGSADGEARSRTFVGPEEPVDARR
jgi:hypothetical protein